MDSQDDLTAGGVSCSNFHKWDVKPHFSLLPLARLPRTQVSLPAALLVRGFSFPSPVSAVICLAEL